MTEQAIAIAIPWRERRRRSGFNRARRFVNDYWLIPILFCYLQLATQIVYPADAPLQRLSKGNLAFFQGIPIAYRILTNDFPNTMIGHFYEIGIHALYKGNLLQPSHDDLRLAFSTPETQGEIYHSMMASRNHHDTEIGGILTISYPPEGARVHLHEIPSLNKEHLAKLRDAIDSPEVFMDLISPEKNQELLDGVGIQTQWAEKIISVNNNERVPEDAKKRVLENFVEMFRALSESRYLLSPYQLKHGLGKIPFNERVVGLFHFHNGLNEAPSMVDMHQSMLKRQIVMTFSEEGWTLYDLVKRKTSKIEFKIDKETALQ
ncbi:MAG: hypothetical protein ACE5GK_00065 [Nitrospiria bacterium]